MSNQKILIVEDELIIAKDIQNTLINLGYETPEIVTSGEDAITKSVEIKPDLILMDIVLKGKVDGIDVSKEILNNLHVPIVYLTAYTDKKTLDRAKQTEPYGYIVKPFDENDLKASVEVALYNSKKDKERKEIERELTNEKKELEKINKLFVNRELKMIELKERIKELEESKNP